MSKPYVVIGGAGLVETGVELRRHFEPWGLKAGGVIFLDGGDVTRTPGDLDTAICTGRSARACACIYLPIGPIRSRGRAAPQSHRRPDDPSARRHGTTSSASARRSDAPQSSVDLAHRARRDRACLAARRDRVGAVHTAWGRQRMPTEIESQLQAQYPGSTRRLAARHVFGTLIASGITIAGKDGKPFVSISTLRVAVAFKPMLRKVVRVDSLDVEGVLVDLAVQPDPKPEPLPGSAEANAKPSAWIVDLPSITVHDARVLTATGDPSMTSRSKAARTCTMA